MTRVVYHFQGQSGRFTVWANCKQNSGCYFCPGIGLAICTNQFHLRKNGRENLKTESFGTFRPVKQDYLLRYSITPANFPLGRPRKSCSIYFPTGFSNQDHTRKLSRSRHVLKPAKTSEQSPTTLGNNTVITQKTWQQVGKITSSQPAINLLFLQTTTDKWNMRRVKLIFNFFSLVQLNVFSL